MSKQKKKVRCIYYCCTNEKGDIQIIWLCVPNSSDSTEIPTTPPSPKCRVLAIIDAEKCDDCKNYVGEITANENSEGRY